MKQKKISNLFLNYKENPGKSDESKSFEFKFFLFLESDVLDITLFDTIFRSYTHKSATAVLNIVSSMRS